jgi:predicted ATPase
MISRITLENFFSFGHQTSIDLNPDINILVGINGSGKSNFLRAIKLLYDGVAGKGLEETFLKDWGGFSSVASFNIQESMEIILSFEFDKEAINKAVGGGYRFQSNPIYQIIIYRAGATSYYLGEKLYAVAPEGRYDNPFIFLQIENSQGVISARDGDKIRLETHRQDEKGLSLKSSELALRQLSDPDRYYPLFTIKRAIEQLAVYEYFDTTPKSSIRQPGSYDSEERLAPNGHNLLSILLKIKNHHSLSYEEIERYIRKINPNFKDVNFDLLGSKMLLVLREQHLSKSVPAEHISDGTLRFLLLLAILLNPGRGSTICLDEPEIGMHPDMINSIADAIKSAARSASQLIIATHSPLLLNAFDLDQILIFEKDSTNKSVVQVKSTDEFDDWQEQYLSGQMWMQGLIGGKRW